MAGLTITVHDLPAPQGSKRHVGGGRMIESSKRVAPWREAVKQAALLELDALVGHPDPDPLFDEPVRINVTFTLPRPRAHYRTGRNAHLLRDHAPTAPARTPDLDKLLRSTFDALTAAGVWRDDAQVCAITSCKTYPDGPTRHVDALPHPGAVITVTTVAEHVARGAA